MSEIKNGGMVNLVNGNENKLGEDNMINEIKNNGGNDVVNGKILQGEKFKGYAVNTIHALDPMLFEEDEKNIFKIKEEKVFDLIESIRSVGQINLVLVNKRNGRVLAGNTRLRAIKLFNDKKIQQNLI